MSIISTLWLWVYQCGTKLNGLGDHSFSGECGSPALGLLGDIGKYTSIEVP